MELYAATYETEKGKSKFYYDTKPPLVWHEDKQSLISMIGHMSTNFKYHRPSIGSILVGEGASMDGWVDAEEYAVIYQTKKGNWKFVNCVINGLVCPENTFAYYAWHEDLATARLALDEEQSAHPSREYLILARKEAV